MQYSNNYRILCTLDGKVAIGNTVVASPETIIIKAVVCNTNTTIKSITMTAPAPPMQRPPSRIPLGLQAVFLAANRGKDVNRPPPETLTNNKTSRGWVFQGFTKKQRTRGRSGMSVVGSVSQGSVVTKGSNKPPTMVQIGSDGKIKGKENNPELISVVNAKPESAPVIKPKLKVRQLGCGK
jgi:hypothetical protein